MYDNLLGAYVNNESFFSKLHPFIKFLFSFCFVIAAGAVQDPYSSAVLTAVLLIFNCLFRLNARYIFKVLRPFRFILIFTLVVQLFITEQGGFISPDAASFKNAGLMTYRLILIIVFSSYFAALTPVTDIVRVLYYLFKPFKIFGISPIETALSMIIALRFIPLLFIESEKIIDSQIVKGIIPRRGEKKTLAKSIKTGISLVIPLLIRTFRYASQISITLRYRRQDDEFFRLKRLKAKDYTASIIYISIAAGVIFVSRYVVII